MTVQPPRAAPAAPRYRHLDPEQIISTARVLSQRIAERFPESGLSRVSQELLAFALESRARLERLRRPHWPTRLAAGAGLLAVIGVLVSAVLAVRVPGEVEGLSSLLQGLEAGINDIVFLSIALFFLFTLEVRLKRRGALRALHELRSIAHIVDMHQLTKDPESLVSPRMATRCLTRSTTSRC